MYIFKGLARVCIFLFFLSNSLFACEFCPPIDYINVYGDAYPQKSKNPTRSTLDYLLNRWDVRFPDETLVKRYDEKFDADLIKRPKEKVSEMLTHFKRLFRYNVFESCMDEIVDDALRELVKNGKHKEAFDLGKGLEKLVVKKLSVTKCANIRKLLSSMLESIYGHWYRLKASKNPLNYSQTIIDLCEKYLRTVDETYDSTGTVILECLKELKSIDSRLPDTFLQNLTNFFANPRFIIKFSTTDVSTLCPGNVLSEFFSYAPFNLHKAMIATCKDEVMEAAIAREIIEIRKLITREYTEISKLFGQWHEYWHKPNLCDVVIREILELKQKIYSKGEEPPYLPHQSYLFWDIKMIRSLLEYRENLRQLLENRELEAVLKNYIKSNINRLIVFLKKVNIQKYAPKT